jgi:hypothetical protein
MRQTYIRKSMGGFFTKIKLPAEIGQYAAKYINRNDAAALFCTSKSMITTNENKIQKLIHSLNTNFPVDAESKENFELFAFSNENYFGQALFKLANTSPDQSEYNKAALLFGESRFLSMLPELSKHTNLIILADIESSLHTHTKHLLNCFRNASSPEEFIEYYKRNNPTNNQRKWSASLLIEALNGKAAKNSLEEYHFLHSIDRYKSCKNALNKLSIINIQLNLLSKEECEKFAEILASFDTKLALCNFTNIHHYDTSYKLKLTTEVLLKNSPHCLFMYATGHDRSDDLSTNFSVKLDDYFNLSKTYSANPVIHKVEDADIDIDDLTLHFCHSSKPECNQTNVSKPFRSKLLGSNSFISSLGKSKSGSDEDDDLTLDSNTKRLI